MHTIFELQQLIEKAIEKVEYPALPSKLYEPISYIMRLGGKRIRPVLLLLSSELFNTDATKAIEAALAIETFHNFTLIHDDIMDNAPLRRGQDTVHIKWGVNNAILSGDVMMVEANKHLTNLDAGILKNALHCFNSTAQGVCEGQQLDMEFEQRTDVSIVEYINMIRLKTAVLVGGAMKLGAIVGGAGDEDANHLYDFGENFGIAFQLQDDILDVYGDPVKFGKQVGGDIISNKQTFLLLKLKELAQQDDLTLLESQYPNTDYPAKIEAITLLYNKYKIRELAVTEMKRSLDIAFTALEKVSIEAGRKQELIQLAESLLDREQ
ncbi:geranylgeranyl diphosphate synthase type II [Pedobacter cryoconitis]|uniref:Geranylgeranyl diphosphate synthase type II n=1 Tax=Pedobacter cryoconitis TaxID=188932 RepID=A0A7W8ZIU3_9SPHI|nr:polyprenyl synthetase family protein [Pedobacter cryoconitis]MBB5634697.1 geranylgeranyl diphosphate synthase type II [Pedobacter cryoconitis]MBB6272172.1 geranylgeranyl diphosphate synthase type II [Pedobacter cryoconitis]